MPENVLQQVETLVIIGNHYNRQPLPQCVTELPLTMSSLHTLKLQNATGATAVHKTVQAVIRTNTLKHLQLTYCDIDYGCVTTLYRWLLTSSKLELLDISLPSTKAIELISKALTTNSTLKYTGSTGVKVQPPSDAGRVFHANSQQHNNLSEATGMSY